MIAQNPNSKRKNPFRKIYDSSAFKGVLANKEKLHKFPLLVDLELTNFCNLKCLFCGQQAMKREKGFIAEETFRKVVDECALRKTPIRFIRWGEPFLHQQIIDFCSYVKNKGILNHITTNGLLVKQEQMEKLVEIGLDSIIFSMQGADKQGYQLMRNNQRYDDLVANILKLVEIRGSREKPFIHISTTITNETEEQINQFIKNWLSIVDSIGVGRTNLSRLTASQIKSFETISKLDGLKKQETIKKIYRPCAEVYQKLSVDWDGKVSCCCGDFDNFLTVGDLTKQSLSDIWQNSRDLKIFRDLLNQRRHKCLTLCSTCWHTYEEF